MSNVPSELKIASSHEWARLEEDGTVTVGITDHAQEALGDVVFVELPEMGDIVTAGVEAGVVESVKAASDIYAPIGGEVIAINEQLEDEPEEARGGNQLHAKKVAVTPVRPEEDLKTLLQIGLAAQIVAVP